MELELTRINHLGGSLLLRRELLVSSLEGVQISFYNDVLFMFHLLFSLIYQVTTENRYIVSDKWCVIQRFKHDFLLQYATQRTKDETYHEHFPKVLTSKFRIYL